MSRVLSAAALAGTLLAATAAGAADLPRRSGAPLDYFAPPPVFTWTGFYLGLNAGVGIGSFTQGSNQLFGNPSGFVGGAQVGYNYQLAPNFLIGGEADIDGSTLRGDNNLPFFGFSGGAKMTMLTTFRGRVGYTLDRALFYVTGGLALASLDAHINDYRGFPFWASQSSLQAGYTVGAGMEYALTNNVSAKVEYLYTSTGNNSYFSYTPDAAQLGIDVSTLRAGVNYHF